MNAYKLLLPVVSTILIACTPTRPPADTSTSFPTDKTAKSEKFTEGQHRQAFEGTYKSGKIRDRAEVAPNTENAAGKQDKQERQAASGKASRANSVSSWELSGAMAARSKSKAWTASVNWLQRGQGTYQIRLFGPLGSGAILIKKSGGVVNLKDGPKSVSSSNADQLLLKETGVRLPVNNLYYWVRGIPAPGGVQSEKRDKSGYLASFQQAGYTINYGNYTAVGGVALPGQIKLQGNGVFIKLAIRRWKI